MWVLESDSGPSAYMRGKENLCSYALRMSIRRYCIGEETHAEVLRKRVARRVVPCTVVYPLKSRGARISWKSWTKVLNLCLLGFLPVRRVPRFFPMVLTRD